MSFDDEPLIIVDPQGCILGHRTKADCHAGSGLLHRAFSVFLFNPQGEVLLQQRSAQKHLWPLFWANSCCSHPRRGEALDQAARRRTAEELNVRPKLTRMFEFIYQASYGTVGSEHELCCVYIGRADGQIAVNRHEVAATQFMAPATLDEELVCHKEKYTPWLKLEWPRLRRQHQAQIDCILAKN